MIISSSMWDIKNWIFNTKWIGYLLIFKKINIQLIGYWSPTLESTNYPTQKIVIGSHYNGPQWVLHIRKECNFFTSSCVNGCQVSYFEFQDAKQGCEGAIGVVWPKESIEWHPCGT